MKSDKLIHEVYKKVKKRKLLGHLSSNSFKIWQSWLQIQNFSTVSPKLRQLGKKNTFTGGVKFCIIVTYMLYKFRLQ